MLENTTFAKAVEEIFRKVSAEVFPEKLPQSPIAVHLAGGAAVHLYTQARTSKDVDAQFNARIHLPEVLVTYRADDGVSRTLFLDTQYRQELGPMQEDYQDRAMPMAMTAPGFDLKILAPVDLVISKLGRFAEHDQKDIESLIEKNLVNPLEFKKLANDALKTYVGNTRSIEISIDLVLGIFRSHGYKVKSTPKSAP
jgi:Nucleotidyltransferase of unknown function (DUF6036)